MDEGEDAGMLSRGEAGGRRPKEHCTADLAQKHGLLEVDPRASRRAGWSHAVVRVPSLSSVVRLKTTSGGSQRSTEKSRATGCGGQRNWRNPKKSLGYTGQHGPQRGEGVLGPTLRHKLLANQQLEGGILVQLVEGGRIDTSKR